MWKPRALDPDGVCSTHLWALLSSSVASLILISNIAGFPGPRHSVPAMWSTVFPAVTWPLTVFSWDDGLPCHDRGPWANSVVNAPFLNWLLSSNIYSWTDLVIDSFSWTDSVLNCVPAVILLALVFPGLRETLSCSQLWFCLVFWTDAIIVILYCGGG